MINRSLKKQLMSAALAGALMFVQSVGAADALPEPIRACAAMRNDIERLACYDKAVAHLESGSVAPSAENMFGASTDLVPDRKTERAGPVDVPQEATARTLREPVATMLHRRDLVKLGTIQTIHVAGCGRAEHVDLAVGPLCHSLEESGSPGPRPPNHDRSNLSVGDIDAVETLSRTTPDVRVE